MQAPDQPPGAGLETSLRISDFFAFEMNYTSKRYSMHPHSIQSHSRLILINTLTLESIITLKFQGH